MLWVKTAAGVMALMPDDWSTELIPGRSDAMVIQNDERGMVTVDFKFRGFRPGYSSSGAMAGVPPGMTYARQYTGREWRARLVADAVAWLQSVYAEGGK